MKSNDKLHPSAKLLPDLHGFYKKFTLKQVFPLSIVIQRFNTRNHNLIARVQIIGFKAPRPTPVSHAVLHTRA
jgi:hypothetical protein